jgi:hypothetical protein
VAKHPPNHAGYYFCHLCGGWVHIGESDLDHVTPKSLKGAGYNPNSDDNQRMSHHWPVYKPDGTIHCIGNAQKGSQKVESVTMEIAPSDEDW